MTIDARVGVIVPVFNGEKYVAGALRSVLREVGMGLDIVVVDDGSTDRSREIVGEIALEHRCVRLLQTDHGGVSRARNLGLTALRADSEAVLYLDCDDLNPPRRIARQLDVLRRHPEYEYVIGKVHFFDSEDEHALMPAERGRSVIARSVQLGAALFRRSLLERFGGLAEDMRYGEDVDLFLRMVEEEVPHFIEDEVAVFYRRHDTNVTNDPARTKSGMIDAIRRSLLRRRQSGRVVALGELFKSRAEFEEVFRHD